MGIIIFKKIDGNNYKMLNLDDIVSNKKIKIRVLQKVIFGHLEC